MALQDFLRGIPLFRNLDDEDLALVTAHLHRENYAKGTIVFREGEVGDTMYLVESGQVAVIGQESNETIAFLGPGNFVGEISLLLAQPRTATLQVTLDATLWAFCQEDFEKLVSTRPGFAREMMRELGRRLVDTTQRKHPPNNRRITALVGHKHGLQLCQAINSQLQKTVGLISLPGSHTDGHASISAGVMPLNHKDMTEATLAESLSFQVEVFKHIVVILPDISSPLARKAARLADTVISVGPPPRWVRAGRDEKDVWEIGPEHSDLLRAARRLTGHTVGLALSSGGARGLAHIGVLKVLRQAGIPVDMVAGTSGGAWFGAFYCAGWSSEQFDTFVDDVKKIMRLPNADFNLFPRTGIFKGRKARDRVIAQSLGVQTFEELQTPLYVVAADVLRGEEVVFDSGSLSDAIRASLSVPVWFDPWYYQGRYCVDGGVVNPLPATLLRQRGADIVIASSVIQDLADSYGGRLDKKPHILQSVFNIVSAMESEVVKKQLPMVDIMIQHNVSAKHTMDFERSAQIVRDGEATARKALPAIQAALNRRP